MSNINFRYQNINGEQLSIRVEGKLLENQLDVVNQLLDEDIKPGYVLVTVAKDGQTFKNERMTGYYQDDNEAIQYDRVFERLRSKFPLLDD